MSLRCKGKFCETCYYEDGNYPCSITLRDEEQDE